MKKVLMVLLGIALVLSMAGVVSANQISVGVDGQATSDTASMTVTLGLSKRYVITVPTTVELDPTGKKTSAGAIVVSDLVLTNSQSLNIYVSSENGWKVKGVDQTPVDNTAHSIGYTMTRDGWNTDFDSSIAANEKVLFATVPMSTYSHANPSSFNIFFTKSGVISEMGGYEDTLTFTVSISTVGQGI